MKKLVLATTLTIFMAFVSPALAQEAVSITTPEPTVLPTSVVNRKSAVLTQAAERKSAILTQGAARKETAASKAAERKDKAQENRLENLRTRAVREIDNRVKSLNSLLTRINNLKKLSEAQKSALVSQVQAEITNLTALKTKIQADTELTVLQGNAKSIVASYRIYALFIPKIHLLTGAEGMLSAAEKMTAAYTELQTRVASAKSQGTDTTEMEEALSAMLAQISAATAEANAAITTVTPLTPDGYPGNKASLDEARQNIKDARQNLQDARKQGKDVLKLLRATQIPSLTVTPTPPPVATATPTTP